MIVIQDVSADPPPGLKGNLFADRVFYIAQRVPNRSDLVKLVTYNGGRLEPVESRAELLIFDHTRDGLPSGAISYRYILDSVNQGRLEDVENHRCGPRAGSVRDTAPARPPRHGRVPFTPQDDYDLYRHVRHCKRNGAAIMGNEIYKQHSQSYPRHSYHSYRDRYVKILSQKRPAGLPVPTPSPEPRPDTDNTSTPNGRLPATFASKNPSNSTPRLKRLSFGGSTPVFDKTCPDLPALVDQFKAADFQELIRAGELIKGATDAGFDQAWDNLAQDPERPRHTAKQWRTLWENCVRPVCEEIGDDKTKLQIYYDAFERWEEKLGPNAGIRKWVDHFRRGVVPKLREQSTTQDQEAAPPVLQQKESVVNGHSQDLGVEEHATSPPQQVKGQSESLGLDGSLSPPIRNSWGKHRRDDDSDAENHNKTPPSKRMRINENAGEHDKIHDSIEFSPTKKLASSPLGERKVIQVGSERSSSPSSELFVPNHGSGKAAADQNLLEEEEEKVQEHEEVEQDEAREHEEDQERQVHEEVGQDESQEHNEDQDNQVNGEDEIQGHVEDKQDEAQEYGKEDVEQMEEHAREVLGRLDGQQVHELLELLRTAPFATPELDGKAPLDTTVMHTVQVLTKDYAGVDEWEWISNIFKKRLQELGIYQELLHHEAEGQNDEEDENRVQEAMNSIETNGQFENEPTPSPESPPARDPTPQPPSPSQPNPSLDTASTFTGSYAHIDDNLFDHPTGLNSGAETEAYIASRLNPPYAFLEHEIVIALHATSAYSTAFADHVLRWMRQNNSTKSKGKARRGRRSSVGCYDLLLPIMPGVWTGEDDKAVLGEADAEEVQRIERKHGLERCEQRKAFLRSDRW